MASHLVEHIPKWLRSDCADTAIGPSADLETRSPHLNEQAFGSNKVIQTNNDHRGLRGAQRMAEDTPPERWREGFGSVGRRKSLRYMPMTRRWRAFSSPIRPWTVTH